MKYNWQQKEWPNFTYQTTDIETLLPGIAERTGRSTGLFEALTEVGRQEVMVELMVAEAIKTSEIENEYLSRQDVLSSVRRNLGFNTNTMHVPDQRAEGISELMVHLRKHFNASLSEAMLFTWHKMVMKGSKGINAGQWRKGAESMQVISGPIGKETVHFEAPPASQVPEQMAAFIQWYNDTAAGGINAIPHAPVRAAIAHVYFESIHPFEDGNGRIGRAISEKALSEGMGQPALISLSRVIEANKSAYYNALKEAQVTNNLTNWLKYFVQVIAEAQAEAVEVMEFTINKSKFFDRYSGQLNARQLKVINRMLEEGPKGFTGGMSAKKYMAITKTSKATATRDLYHLVQQGVFEGTGAGRSTRYNLKLT